MERHCIGRCFGDTKRKKKEGEGREEVCSCTFEGGKKMLRCPFAQHPPQKPSKANGFITLPQFIAFKVLYFEMYHSE